MGMPAYRVTNPSRRGYVMNGINPIISFNPSFAPYLQRR